MLSGLRLFCLLSRANYLLDDLPVSSLIDSDPAWPVRLLTRVYMVHEHLRDECLHKVYKNILSQRPKNGKGTNDNGYQQVPTFRETSCYTACVAVLMASHMNDWRVWDTEFQIWLFQPLEGDQTRRSHLSQHKRAI